MKTSNLYYIVLFSVISYTFGVMSSPVLYEAGLKDLRLALDSISKLYKLDHIDFSFNQITSIEPVKNLSQINILELKQSS